VVNCPFCHSVARLREVVADLSLVWFDCCGLIDVLRTWMACTLSTSPSSPTPSRFRPPHTPSKTGYMHLIPCADFSS
jgi:hypothetical protein